MADFKFIRIPNLETWVVLAPKRAKRPVQEEHKADWCPFCPDSGIKEKELYRVGGEKEDDWQVRVIKNKFPFAPIHELVIHSPVHTHSHMSDLPLQHIQWVIETYVNRFNEHKRHGTVCIFRNAGHEAGESIGHPHSQIAVVPRDIDIVVPRLEEFLEYKHEHFNVGEFMIICPPYSQWPDEVWIVPKHRGKLFGEIEYKEIQSLAFVLRRIIRILNFRHGHNFPNNYYIFPTHDWYLRIMPRAKIPGGFEMATGIFVNTQDPTETMKFIKTHFFEEDEEKILKHKAEYRRGV